MQVLNLIQKHSYQVPYKIGKELGTGADGQCFNLINIPDKVIKFCVLYEQENISCRQKYQQTIAPIINYLINNPSRIFARVYEHKYIGIFEREFIGFGKQPYILYYYLMEKLNKISEDERKVFHTLLSHEDRGIFKNYSIEKNKKIIEGLRRGLDFDAEKVMLFCENLKTSPIVHLDLHPRNIMKDSLGNFKLIDFDRIDWRNKQ